MRIKAFLARSYELAVWLFVLTGLVMTFAPRAQRAWEESIAEDATVACQKVGGTALVGEDRVVSCLPAPPPKGRAP